MPTPRKDDEESVTLDIHDVFLGVTLDPVSEDPEADEE